MREHRGGDHACGTWRACTDARTVVSYRHAVAGASGRVRRGSVAGSPGRPHATFFAYY